jgi:hypothetical protein
MRREGVCSLPVDSLRIKLNSLNNSFQPSTHSIIFIRTFYSHYLALIQKSSYRIPIRAIIFPRPFQYRVS